MIKLVTWLNTPIRAVTCAGWATFNHKADWLNGLLPFSQSVLSWVSPAVSMTKRLLTAASALGVLATPHIGYTATPFNTAITNMASANYGISGTPVTSTGSVTITTGGRTPAKIEFLQYVASGTTGTVENVNTTQCNGNPLPNPNFIGPPASSLTVSGALRLAPATQYTSGDPVFIRVTDLDHNLNAAVAETISVVIATTAGDAETLILTETGISTGVFIGYIQSAAGAVNSSNCTLNTGNEQKLTVKYTDPLDTVQAVADSALFDPFGIMFDSSTGLGVNGAKVRMIDTATNLPATVFCDDGVTILPQPVTTGSPTVCSPVMVQGGYRFPRAVAGTYRLEITPPATYSFPSVVANATLQTLPPAPYVLIAGSRGEVFNLMAGPPLQIDVPLDPSGGSLQIIKTVEKAIVGEGEFVPYTISIKNMANNVANSVVIADTLPLGFRYAKNSAKLANQSLANPSVSGDGRTLSFNIGNLNAGATVTLRYVAEVTAGAKTGNAENIAFATSHPSNTGRASVTVREDLMRSKSILMGRVVVGSCDANVDNDTEGLANARVLLEDGTYMLTDTNGRWHADNIKPGTHVIQLDLDSLPSEYEVLDCQQNSRFAGRTYSQFVNLRGGSLWRADFYVQKKSPSLNTHVAQASTQATDANLVNSNSTKQDLRNQGNSSLVEKLPYNKEWLATTPAGIEWLHPNTSFVPAIPAIKIAVKASPQHKVTVTINGVAVSPLNYDGMVKNATNTVALFTWSGVNIKEGNNSFKVVVSDSTGKVIADEMRSIHYSTGPVKVELVPERSTLIADGKTAPIIAVRFLDKEGKPVRKGVNGEYQLNTPYASANQIESIQRDPLAGKVDSQPRYDISDDGVAFIKLAPTTQSGEALLKFNFNTNTFASANTQSNTNNGDQIRAWLAPGQRDWVLVGFAQGTVGHKQLSGNTKALKEKGADDELFDEDRVAFYAKGTVKGDTLLTIAYDTAKQRGNVGSNANLHQLINPSQYYTLYADATQPYFDAASARKLYVKVERKQFYAMFGDYDTGLTVTEFARYSRTANGLKSEFKGEKFSYNAFATLTAQAFKRDEIAGNGTSGIYKLSSGKIIENTDKIRIETRDRFHSEVIIKTQGMSRFLDYDIDYQAGTLFFRAPIQSRDAGLNPTYIVAEYEANDNQDEKVTAGGRVAVKPTDKSEIGLTLVHEGNVGAKGNLQGIDASVQITEKTKLIAEIANSNRDTNSLEANGQAWKVEALHNDEKLDARAYVRQQDEGFGLGQQAGGEVGTRKVGADARYKLSDNMSLQGQAYQQGTLSTGAKRDVLEARADQKINDEMAAYYGTRYARDEDGTGVVRDSKQAIGGISYALFDKKLNLRASTEISLGSAESTDFPNRYIFGADYKLSEQTQLFAEHEFARGKFISADTTRVGMRVKPWTGGELAASLGNQTALDSERLYSDLGLTQKWQINEQWQTDAAFDRVQTLKAKAGQQNINVPLSSGSATTDNTAISLGANYHNKVWSANSRIEWRDSDIDTARNFLIGAQRTLDDGRVLASGFSYKQTNSQASTSRIMDARLSYAYRPNTSEWVWLNRLDYIDDLTENTTLTSHVRKLVNNTNANWMPNRQTQLSLQYGAKYVFDTIDGKGYSGYTDLLGAEIRRDLGKDWDVGAHGSMLHSWNSKVRSWSAGVSVGYNLMENTWVSIGYNFLGFDDSDFSGAEYRSKGLYATVRIKFDQDTLKLNDKKSNAFTLNL
ncbi:MAG: DUF11 domain-containing protein [Methylotenera sp.]|nr:DUF11 domain-containing protein [Methylotenera sp.]